MVAIALEQWGKVLLYSSEVDSPKCMSNTEPYAGTTSLQWEMSLNIHTKMVSYIIWEHREHGWRIAMPCKKEPDR